MNCKKCDGSRFHVRGYRENQSGKVTKVQCVKCGKYDLVEGDEKPPQRTARILLLDIETAYMEGAFWRAKQRYIPQEAMLKDWSMLCWAAKWLFEPEIMGKSVSGQEARERRDGSILEGMWELLDRADIVIGHNVNGFDIKSINTRLFLAGYKPPSKYLCVDTLKVARERFNFPYNNLDYLGKKILGLSGKKKMSMSDWMECADGDEAALENMLEYCKIDVAPLLEELYLKFLPWIPNHPNLNVFSDHDENVCRNCESPDLEWSLQYPTPAGIWSGFRCNSCGAIGRGKGKDYKIKGTEIA